MRYLIQIIGILFCFSTLNLVSDYAQNSDGPLIPAPNRVKMLSPSWLKMPAPDSVKVRAPRMLEARAPGILFIPAPDRKPAPEYKMPAPDRKPAPDKTDMPAPDKP